MKNMKMGDFPWKDKKIKCVILCGGEGTRLFPLTLHKQKSMIEVAGKPVLGHIVDYWKKYTNDFVFIVHYKKEEVMVYARSLPVNAEFIELEEVKGIAQGLMRAKDVLTDNFIVALGDCLIKGDFKFPNSLDLGVGVWPTNDHYHIKSSYSVEIDGELVKKVVEKPVEILNNLCGMGSYFFSKKIFDYIDKTAPSSLRNQIELTDAIQKAIEEGEKVKIVEFIGHYININRLEDLKRAEDIFCDF